MLNLYHLLNKDMRFKEFISQVSDPKLIDVHPDQEKHKRMRNKLELAIAVQDAIAQPTSDDVAMAFAKVSQMQQRANKKFAKQHSLPRPAKPTL